jgi:hypothetical protein
MSFAVGAMLASKSALDTCLSGQYVQSMMICRSLIETWIRIAYLDLQPESARNWFWHESRGPQAPKNETMLKRLRDHPVHRDNAQMAPILISEADQYAHPSPQTMASVYKASLAHGTLGTFYRQSMAARIIHLAATSCFLIAEELPKIITVDPDFDAELFRAKAMLEAWDTAQPLPYRPLD